MSLTATKPNNKGKLPKDCQILEKSKRPWEYSPKAVNYQQMNDWG